MSYDAHNAELLDLAGRTGPMLHMRGVEGGRVHLVAILVRPVNLRPLLATSDGEVAPTVLLERYGLAVLQYAFALPMAERSGYTLEGQHHTVNTMFHGDIGIAYVSCNGQEHGDGNRAPEERNVMWRHLAERHRQAPLHLLLHGGDQVYADEILDAHPVAREWGRENGDAGEGATDAVPAIREALSLELLRRYLELNIHPHTRELLAQVPSLAMWDDHDICDGWGSLPDRKLDSPVGRTVFEVAREHFLLFQLGGAPDALPSICLDREGVSLGWHVRLPGLHIIAPDLRSERRRKQVMGAVGWDGLERALADAHGCGRVLLMSSVPALGPRLSLIEGLMRLTPAMEKYEDDLRDQWQSRTHRAEWKRFLRLLLKTHEAPQTRLTVISGEIHLATRGTLAGAGGPIHQLVASGITHPPPPAVYARALGALAWLGEAPLRNRSLRLCPLPGQQATYTAQRNYLMLQRRAKRWHASWQLEQDGATPPLDLGDGERK